MNLAGAKPSLVVIAVSALLCQCLACAAHHDLTDPAYRLVGANSQYFLTSGAPQIRGQHLEFQISLGNTETNRQVFPGDNCSVRGQWFSLYPSKPSTAGNWTVETPAVGAWAEAAGHTDLKPEWDKFLQTIIALQQRQCFPRSVNFIEVKEKIVEGMAMPADESLLYRYSFGQGGYVDLTAGIELRIERNISASGANGMHPRTIITSYGFTNTAANETQIHIIRSQDSLEKKEGDLPNIPDKKLASEFQSLPHLRVILQRLTVSAGVNSPAILLGASDMASLDEATQPTVTDPKTTCADLGKFPVKCVDFNGLVTVSPVLQVKVNRRLRYAPLGSKVWYVFPPQADVSSNILKTLRIRRQYGKAYRDIQFSRNQEDVGQILLLGGDEISWSSAARR
jgi:hypothetical protein